MKYDVVYYFQGERSEELKYSIRSVEKNISYNRIFLVGDKPKWFKETRNSIYIESKNLNIQKYGLGSVSILHLKNLIKSDKCPENFLLFNDDFFVLRKINNWVDYYRNDIDYNQKALLNYAYHKKTIRSLSLTVEKKKYNLHIPILINKEKFEELYNIWSKLDNHDIDFRTLYGNMFIKTNNQIADCKIGSNEKQNKIIYENLKNLDFVSTSDDSFKNGEIGKILRKMFNMPSSIEML